MTASVLPASPLVHVPEWVAENMEREALVDEQLGRAEWLNRELRAKDPSLSLIWYSERAPEQAGMIPGRWHVKRRNPGSVDTYLPITGPDGEYREPTARVLDELDRRDLWKGDVARQIFEQSRRQQAARAHAEQLQAEQRRDHIAEDIRAAKRVPGDGGLDKRKWAKK